MKKINLLIIVLILSITTIMAQTDPKPKPTKADMEANKEKMEAMKVAFITKELELTEQQAKTFWPIYNQQEDEKKALRKSSFDGVKKGDMKLDELTDDEANEMINNYLSFKTKDLDLTKKYVAEYKKVLNTKQVAKLLVSEDKFKKMLVNQAGMKPNMPGKKPMPEPPAPPAPK
ncbi:MAG: hypothetical protein IPK18_06205 [Sphingobacteriales bacterium]|nr:MAG: hypothetical protein IPK18_06205 [Sphingobacteriales bacterium]